MNRPRLGPVPTLLAGVVASLVLVAHGARADEPPPGVAYAALLDRAATAAAHGDVATARDAVARAERLAPTSSLLAVVAADLSRTPPDLDDATRRLAAASGALRLPEGSRPGDLAEARRRLEEIYTRPGLRDLERGASGSSPLAAALAALRDTGAAVVGHLGPSGTAVLAGLVLAAIGALVLRLLAATAASPPLQAPSHGPPADDDPDVEWRLAEAAGSRGDYREAVRRAFRSALGTVARRRRVAVEPSATTGELVARAAGDPALHAALLPAAAGFERAWYGPGPVTAEDWARMRETCLVVRRLAGRRSRPKDGVAGAARR